MNSETYVRAMSTKTLPLLQEVFGENGDFIYCDDGAPCHRSRNTVNWKLHYFGEDRICKFWAGYSPDRNLIEHCWALIWEEVNTRRPTTMIGLKRAIQAGWDKVTPDFLRRLYASQDRRDNAILAARGGHTKY